MEKKLLEVITEQTNALMAAPSCCAQAKEAAGAWLAAVGTPDERAQTERYLAELEADIMPVDGLVAFTESPQGAAVFGADTARQIAAHAQALKDAGAPYCDCPACAAAAAILAKKEALLG